MKRRALLGGMAAAVIGAASRLQSEPVTRSERTVQVCDTRVRLVMAERGTGLIYFHPHENEHSSAVVTRHIVRDFGGRLIEIRAQGESLITFHSGGKTYSFDPNRLFTEAGIASSLAHFAPIPQAAVDCATRLRDALLKLFGDGRTPLVGVHNDGSSSISVQSYQKGGRLASQCLRVAVNPHERARNYFQLMDERLYRRLHHAGFNAVLLAPDATDDGSLRAFCQRKGWKYIGVQTASNDMGQQERMLRALQPANE